MTPWLWRGKPFEDPAGHAGFVYELTMPDGRRYIGAKTFFRKAKLPPLKGRKRARRVVKETDWRTYMSSCEAIKAHVAEHGAGGIERRILHLVGSKAELAWMELREQVERNVLIDDVYLNGIVNARINAAALKAAMK